MKKNSYLSNYASLEEFFLSSEKDDLKKILNHKNFEDKVNAIFISLEFLCKESDLDEINVNQEFINPILNILYYNITLFLSNVNMVGVFSMIQPPYINHLIIEKSTKNKDKKIENIFDTSPYLKSKKIFWSDDNKLIHLLKGDIYLGSLIFEKKKLPETLLRKNKTSMFFYDKIGDKNLVSFREEDDFVIYSLIISYKDAKFNQEQVKNNLNKLENQLNNIIKGWFYFKTLDNEEDKEIFLDSVL